MSCDVCFGFKYLWDPRGGNAVPCGLGWQGHTYHSRSEAFTDTHSACEEKPETTTAQGRPF